MFYRFIVRAKPDAKDFVELGCGLGFFAYTICTQVEGCTYRTGDISDYARNVAKAKLQNFKHVEIVPLDAEYPPFKASIADVVVSFDVLEHL